MWRHQQVDCLLRQAGPNLVELPLQFHVVQTLSQNPCGDAAAHMSRQISTNIIPTIIINIQAWPRTSCNQYYVIWLEKINVTLTAAKCAIGLLLHLSHWREVIFKNGCIWITLPPTLQPPELRSLPSHSTLFCSPPPFHCQKNGWPGAGLGVKIQKAFLAW